VMWPARPDDEWIEITCIGDSEPRFMLGMSGVDREIARAKAAYLEDKITIEEFEAAIDPAIKGARAA
jgi:hypothetical protein